MIEGRKLESYVKATMETAPLVAMDIREIREWIWNAFDDVESLDDIHTQRIRRILISWVKRGWVFRIAVQGCGGRSGEQSYWILSGVPFEVEE